jgi:SNF2 family DNA or RNA helicase
VVHNFICRGTIEDKIDQLLDLVALDIHSARADT